MSIPQTAAPSRYRRHLPLIGLAALCVGSFGIMALLALNFRLAGKWYLADVGNIQYCLINTWHGRFMYSPLDEGNFFAFHFAPFLFLLAPLVWLSKFPIPLVLSYQLALSFTPIPIYALARRMRLSPWIALALGFWFLCNNFVGSLQLANHFEAFYVLFALCTMAMLGHRNRYGWWIFALFAFSIKEDCAVWMLGFALWALVFPRLITGPDGVDGVTIRVIRKRSVILAVLCIVWGLIAAGVMAFAAQGTANNAGKYLERMGGISIGMDTLWMYLLLAAGTGGLCLLNWRVALLLLIPAPVLLGNFFVTRQLLYYYSYPFLPFLAFATVMGVAALRDFLSRRREITWFSPVMAGLLIVLGAGLYILPTRTDNYHRFPLPVTPRDEMRLKIATEILPANVPVAIQFGLWGVTPWRVDTVLLKDNQLQDHHYVFMDLYGIHGLTPEDNVRIMTRLRDEVASGRRKQLLDRYDFIILSPAR